MIRVIGITIGPIFETILMAPSPLSLWFSSYFFSNVAMEICVGIDNKGGFRIITPAYNKENNLSDGVGKYHDRIIFIDDENRSINDIKQIINSIINTVIIKISSYFPVNDARTKEFLNNYIQIHYVIKDINDDEQIILSVSHELDCLEMMNSFNINNDFNPFIKLYIGESEEKRNELIKKSSLYTALSNNQLSVNGKIRSIEDIVRLDKEKRLKKYRYYAVVNADGDRMGKVLEKLIKPEDCIDFSKMLLEHASECAKMIKEFGGMTIYAGGDDLLFLAPIVNDDETKTILDLCDDLSKTFRERIARFVEDKKELLDKLGDMPSLSLGVSIQYYKYPLYEAFNKCYSLLNNLKNTKNKKRNRCSINVNLHSGQSFDFIYNNTNYEEIKKISINKNEKSYLSLIKHIKTYINSINLLDKDIPTIDKEQYKKIMLNYFDNADQKKYKEYIMEVFDVYYTIMKSNDPIQCKTELKDDKKNIRGLLSLLLFFKFVEEEEDGDE